MERNSPNSLGMLKKAQHRLHVQALAEPRPQGSDGQMAFFRIRFFKRH
jgi:hypothetical protein